jgi:hypothetical protein
LDNNMSPHKPIPDANVGTVHRAERPSHVVYGRNPVPTQAADAEILAPAEFVANAFAQIKRDIRNIAKMIQDVGRPVDEYNAQEWNADAEITLNILPQWEFAEKIESIIVVGPAGACTLQLGDRVWPLVIPASGILTIAPVGVMLDRTDIRQLTAASPGAYSVELMGYADTRWSA